MSESPASENPEEEGENRRKALHQNGNQETPCEIRPDLGYNGESNSGRSDLEFIFEVREITGPEGEQLTLAQARALRRALEWAAAYDQQTQQGETSGSGEEKPRTA